MKRVTKIPLLVRDAILILARIRTPVKIYGPPEFFMTVMAIGTDADFYGERHLADFNREYVGKDE